MSDNLAMIIILIALALVSTVTALQPLFMR